MRSFTLSPPSSIMSGMAKESQATSTPDPKKSQSKAEHAGPEGTVGSLFASNPALATGDSLHSQATYLERLRGVQRQAAVAHIGRVQGNHHVRRLVKVLQRQTPADPGTDQDDPVAELKKLNGKSMSDLLVTLAGLDNDKFTRLQTALPQAAGQVHVPRLRVAFKAVQSKGTGAAPFALENRADLTALEFMDQRDAVLRFVDPGFKAPAQLQLGDKLMGGKAIIHGLHLRVRTGAGFTWQANNPGAIGSEPSKSGFKTEAFGSYAGKVIGPAHIAIFPDEGTGLSALHAWIQYKADKGLSFKGFFAAHAPAPKSKEDKGNVGNNPNLYFEEVAKRMGLNPDAVANKPLAAIDIAEMANAIQVQEGWLVGKELGWDDPQIPENDRFALLYSEWLDPQFAMPPG